MRTRWWMIGALALAGVLAGACEDDNGVVVIDGDEPAPPRALTAWYFDRAVYVTWELSPGWDEDAFRVYSKRTTDPDYFLIAEVTNCSAGLCSYTDVNVVPDVSYEYYVTAVDPVSGLETASPNSVEVFVPQPVPPPVPGGVRVVAMDNAAFIQWDGAARADSDFAFYRVYLDGGTPLVLGETDSEGFLDLLAANGETFAYFVTSVDDLGHESGGSAAASGTPRPDFHGEWVYAYQDQPTLAGFRFQEDESVDPLVDGDAPSRHFRLEVDDVGWWLVAGSGTQFYQGAFETTALRCGPGADAGCTDIDLAPSSGYTNSDLPVDPQLSYVMRVIGADGQIHYAAIRVELQGFDQDGNAIMIFDWAYQLQAGNLSLAPAGP